MHAHNANTQIIVPAAVGHCACGRYYLRNARSTRTYFPTTLYFTRTGEPFGFVFRELIFSMRFGNASFPNVCARKSASDDAAPLIRRGKETVRTRNVCFESLRGGGDVVSGVVACETLLNISCSVDEGGTGVVGLLSPSERAAERGISVVVSVASFYCH